MRNRQIIAGLVLALLVAAPVAAQLPSIGSSPVLTVSGEIAETNAGAEAHFDLDLLRSLDWVEVETHTPFTDGPQIFAGPTLASLLAAVGASGGTIIATALNGYHVEIPVSHAAAHGVILAVEHDGKRMRIRDKGPVWIIYPQDAEGAAARGFETEMIWQLTRLEIRP